MTRFVLVLALALMAATVGAGPRKVLVLPVDGTADATLRSKLTVVVQDLAKGVPGELTNGDTTFAETATAVGCDPNRPACVDTVLGTLAVDEVVWGTATPNADGSTTLVVKRATKGTPPHEQTAIIQPTESPDVASSRIAPLFGVTGTVGLGSGSATPEAQGSGSAAVPEVPATPWSDQKKLGVGLAVGGGALVVVGLALWASESGVQDDINNAPDQTAAQIQALKDLESKAQGYAWGGNIAMVLGLGAGGYGAYLLWKDHKEHALVTPQPAPGGGVTFVLRGRW
ncbi:MAG TPA: hypothetical protein VLT45_14505 [Kofleriaceae bacterium]|nr:hypothetical protein [Kofleriaceae bacterium]